MIPFITNAIRPDRLTSKKDEQYHVEMGRWTLNAMNHPLYQKYIIKTLVNWSFYKGGDGQWIFDEDLESFFMDESGDIRNRLKISKNLIRPMVKQYIGNTVRLAYNARAKTTSDFVINNRERELNKMKFFYQVGKAIPEFDPIIRKNIPLGDSEVETEELFDSMFDDNFAETINNMLNIIEREINIEEIKVMLSKNLALSGLGIYKGYEQNGEYLGEAVDPLFFFWDISAIKPDLSDAEYQGQWYWKDVPSLFERFQKISKSNRERIESWSKNQSMNVQRTISYYYTTSGSKVPVYETYWRDFEQQEYGYVMDEFNYPMFVRINHEESKFTDKDLITPPPGAHEKILNGEKKKKVFLDVLRYCIFIPKEEIGSKDGDDIVLEWGEVPYGEKNRLKPSSCPFPFKCYAWEYDKGEVISPIDDAINPQRFINRMLSIAESHVNNARGTGTVIAESAISSKDGQAQIHRNVNNSKTIFVDTDRVGGVQNAVGTYGSGVNASIMNIYNVAQQMQQSLGEITGVNEAMTGTQGASDALVGVVQAQIQRGSLVQETFYYALTSILLQAYQHMATVGKRIYHDNPRRLAIMTGDGGAKILDITSDMANEDFRVYIERTESEPSAIANANNLLFTLMQAGMLDPFRAAMLFNRATPDQVAKSMREYQIEQQQAKIEQNKMQQQQAIGLQQQQQQMQQQNQQLNQQAIGLQIGQDERDKEHDLQREQLKGDLKMQKDVVNNFMNT